MPGYQPRLFTDHVWVNGTDIHTYAKSTGLGIRVTEMRGWDDRPDIRDSRDLRMGQDGEYANNLYLGGRTISIAGAVHGSSWEDLQTRKRALAAVFVPSSTEVLLKVPDPATASPTGSYSTTGMTGYERVSCRVVEPIMFGDMIGSAAMSFQVVLRASDPRVYSDTVTSTDSGTSGAAARTVTVDQGGSYETPPTITVTGPTGSDWSIAEPTSGLSISVSGLTLAATETSTIDLQSRTVEFAGTYQTARTKSAYPPVGLWMLNETSGTTADNFEGTSARDGTYTGGFSLNQSAFATGIASVDVDGSTGYISIPYQSALHPSSVIFEGWFYFDSLTGTQTIIDGITSNAGFRFDWTGSAFRATWGTGSTTTSFSRVPYITAATGTWYRVVLSADAAGGIIAFEVRDTAESLIAGGNSGGGATYVAAGSGGHRLGATLSSASFFNGRLSAAAIYTYSLSALAEIVNEFPWSNGASSNAYTYLEAASSRWANLGTGSSTYTLSSSGLNTGSKLNVSYRDARL